MYNNYGQYPPPVVSLKASFEKCVLHSKLSKEFLRDTIQKFFPI